MRHEILRMLENNSRIDLHDLQLCLEPMRVLY